MKNLLGRDIWLDIDAVDSEEREYNVEIQRSDKGADRKRARYHSCILDAHLLQPNEDFSKLPETYIIFVTENDVIGGGLPLYFIERQIINMDQPFNDGEHIVYINGEDRNNETGLGRLMHDFFCTSPEDMNYKQLADKVRYFKEDEEGVKSMCRALEAMREEAAKNAVEQNNTEIAMDMIKDGKLSLEQIARYTRLAIERVKELASLQVVQ